MHQHNNYKRYCSNLIIISFVSALIVFLIFPLSSSAKVTGPCANCHTMHNSQNGAAMARTGSNVGWDGSGKLAGGSLAGPQNTLLVTGCVGCHSSTTDTTVINFGGNKIPIVYNTVEPAYMAAGGGSTKNALAGGNFYWVAQGGAVNDVKGHNVYGISGQDNNISAATGAPGRNGGPGCAGCHYSLATDPASSSLGKNGCEGCHFNVSHHTDNNWYRFLKGHMGDNYYVLRVAGSEDPDWEQTYSSSKHNIYKGTNASYNWGTGLQATKSISAFCSGCHHDFHTSMGSSSPWIRHPTDIVLPQTGEYNSYNPVTSYSVEAPVAWLDQTTPARAGAVVMCLSCHRAHGSPYRDILRWDYDTMIAGTTGANATKGCFTCHTGKNGL